MSSAATTWPVNDAAAQAPARPPRSYIRRVVDATMVRWGARLGVLWIAVLALLAVFAPFIANSHPILIKLDGKWSSPMLRHLTPSDATLAVAFLAAAALSLLRRVSVARRVLAFLGVLLIAGVLSAIFIEPPTPVVFEQYREARAQGRVQSVIHTLIPYSPSDRLRDRPGSAVVAPWWAPRAEHPQDHAAGHWLGTESNGSDLASRMIHASRIALAIGFIATGIALVIGVVIGGVMGYFSGIVDLVGMRLVEVFEFIPQLFLLLMFVAFFPGDRPEIFRINDFAVSLPRIYLMMAIIGLTGWGGYARFIRAEFLKLRQQDFVQAAIACGLPLRSILFRHMLPNGLTPVLVSASFGVAGAILAEATLSFLGLGLIDEPSWGQLLNQATRATGAFTWWLAVFPGLAIFLTVFAYNLVGESLRDAIDPHVSRNAG